MHNQHNTYKNSRQNTNVKYGKRKRTHQSRKYVKRKGKYTHTKHTKPYRTRPTYRVTTREQTCERNNTNTYKHTQARIPKPEGHNTKTYHIHKTKHTEKQRVHKAKTQALKRCKHNQKHLTK